MVDNEQKPSRNWYETVVAHNKEYEILSPKGASIGSAVIFSGEKARLEECTFKPASYAPGTGGRKPLPEGAKESLSKASTLNRRIAKGAQANMNPQDRYIDARLAGIESKLDARMEAMQRFQEQAETRFQKAEDRFYQAEERFSGEVAALHRTVNTRFDEARRHSTIVALSTVGGVFAGFAIVIAIAAGWIGDQGAWLRDSVNRIEQRVEAQPAPAAPAQLEPEAQPEPPAASE